MKKWLNNLKKKTADRQKEAADPKAQQEKIKQDKKKTAERTLWLIGMARKGTDGYNKVAKKVEEITTDAVQKTSGIAEVAKPLAEKVDDVASGLTGKAKGLFQKAADKVDEVKKDQASKPSTGSSILDILYPAVPETDATKPKVKKDEPPSAPPAP